MCINGVGVLAADSNGMHLWADEPDVEEHDFTRFKVDATGTARAERDVRSILLVTTAGHGEATPIQSTTLATISLIVAAGKPIGKLNFVAPLSFTIAFE